MSLNADVAQPQSPTSSKKRPCKKRKSLTQEPSTAAGPSGDVDLSPQQASARHAAGAGASLDSVPADDAAGNPDSTAQIDLMSPPAQKTSGASSELGSDKASTPEPLSGNAGTVEDTAFRSMPSYKSWSAFPRLTNHDELRHAPTLPQLAISALSA